jgi:lytic cellulose monooxygenase (C1-hydroxylating)
MGLMPSENAKVQDVEFFKIDESTYDPATEVWGTDQLIKDNSTRTVTIPSNIKPGMYVVRHEIISLHFAFRENNQKHTSGAQFYPTCFKVQVLGAGKDTPAGEKLPGAYHWNDKGILDNIYYSENSYVS